MKDQGITMSDNRQIKTFIYALIDPFSMRIRYVGRSVNPKKRLIAHICTPTSNGMKAWIEQLKIKGLTPVLEILHECCSETWSKTERECIEKYRSLYPDLLNITRGGDGLSAEMVTEDIRIKMRNAAKNKSPETREKMRMAKLGKKRSQELKEKMREIKTGTKHSAEARAKIGEASRGRVKSPETRAKLSKAMKSRGPCSPEVRAKISAAKMGHTVSSESRERMSAARKKLLEEIKNTNDTIKRQRDEARELARELRNALEAILDWEPRQKNDEVERIAYKLGRESLTKAKEVLGEA